MSSDGSAKIGKNKNLTSPPEKEEEQEEEEDLSIKGVEPRTESHSYSGN